MSAGAVGLTQFSWTGQLRLVLNIALARLRLTSRYRGWFLLDLVLPTVLAALPILLGQAVSGGAGQAAANFERNTGTPNYVAYLVVGSNIFGLVASAFWNIGFWMRRERQTGTLEALYLAPTGRGTIMAGIGLYGALRSTVVFIVAFILGCLLFGVNPLQGNLLLALVFIAVGLVPLYGLSLLYGALILRVKEANALVNLAQWVVSFLMGVYFPITVFPPLLRAVAYLFPPTWMNNGARASLLGVGFFFEHWYFDLAVLFGFGLVLPMLGLRVFARTERSIQRNEGIGEF